MNRRSALVGTVAGALLSVVAGCGTPTSVSGTVTYEDQPVGKGWITFLPADGQGPTAGGQITNGQYRASDLTPGKKIVQIIGVRAVKFARSSEEMAEAAAEAVKKGDKTGLIDRADEIPPNAQGNNGTIEVKAGQQTFDFHLKRPSAR